MLLTPFFHRQRLKSSLAIIGIVGGVLSMGLGAALIIWHVSADTSRQPSVNGVCDGLDTCLEPLQEYNFVARAIEPDAGQTINEHEWDFLFSTGVFGSQSAYVKTVKCDSDQCSQACGDGHTDCSSLSYNYDQPALFAATNELKVQVAMRGVDSEDMPGVAQQRDVGLAIAYVGSDERGNGHLSVEDINRSGFMVVWYDVTDVDPAHTGYNFHIDKLDADHNIIPGESLTIPVANNKSFGDKYSYPFSATSNSLYLVWVSVYYVTANGVIERQSLSNDQIAGVEVAVPANSAPQISFSIPPASPTPNYVLTSEQSFSLIVTAVDNDGDNISNLSIASLPSGAHFNPISGASTVNSTFTWTPDRDQEGDYNLLVSATDQLGARTQVPLVIHVSTNDFAATDLNINTSPPGAQNGISYPNNQGTPATVIASDINNPNLVFSFIDSSSGQDAMVAYDIRLGDSEAGVINGTDLIWESNWVNFASPLAVNIRSSDIAYSGPLLVYNHLYYWGVKLRNIYNLESLLRSDFNVGQFKLRPQNYTPTLEPISDKTVDVGTNLTFDLLGADQDITEGVNQTLTYFIQGSSPSARLTLNAGSGAVSFTPIAADLAGSPHTVTFCVRDSYTTPAQACQTTHITVNLNLTVPGGLSVNFNSPVQGQAAWTDNTSGEDGFQLDRVGPAPARDNLVSTPANTTNGSFAFNDCNGTSTVDFRLRAYAIVGGIRQFSAAANASAVRPGFAPPTSLTATRLTANSARLSWTAGTTGQTGYIIYRNGTQVGTAAVADTSFDVTGLTPGTTYVLSVRPYVTISSCSPSQVLGGQANLNWMQPNPNLSFNPNTLTFADQVVNTVSAVKTIRVQNSGTVSLSITSSLLGTDASSFQIVNSVTNYSLAVGNYWDAQIRFRPISVGDKSAQFKVTDASLGVDVSGNLQGTGVPAAATSLTAAWSDPNRLSLNWTFSSEPNGWQINLNNYSNNPVEEEGGNITGSSFNIANCYSVTGTTHTVSLRAFSGTPRVYSTSISTNAGERPGWELPSPDPTFSWLGNDSVRMTWTDPSTSGSQYEILVLEGATRRFNGTTTADATTFDITGLTPGTTYTVKMRPFRILPTCGSAIIWGAIKTLSYINPIIDIQAFIQDFSRPTSSINLRGIPLGFLAHVPIKLKNNGNVPLTINYLQLQTSEGVTLDDPLSAPPAPWNPGVEWTFTVGTSPIATTTLENNIITDLVLGTSNYGEVKRLPIRMYGLVDDPTNALQIFVTNGSWAGNLGGQVGGNNKCNTDNSSERNPSKSYKALIWSNNAITPGVLINNGIYRKVNGSFIFGTEYISIEPPIIIQSALNSVVWTGRTTGLESDLSMNDCTSWTASNNFGKEGYANSVTQWSSSISFGCAASDHLICVEVPTYNLALSSFNIDFGLIMLTDPAATRSVNIINSGTANITITGATLSGSSEFSLLSSINGLLSPGASRTITIQYDPAVNPGPDEAILTITSNEVSPITLSMYGHGATAAKRLTITQTIYPSNFLASGSGTLAQRANALCQSDPWAGNNNPSPVWKALLQVNDTFLDTALHSGVTYVPTSSYSVPLFTATYNNDVTQAMHVPVGRADYTRSNTYSWTGATVLHQSYDCSGWSQTGISCHGGVGSGWRSSWGSTNQLTWFIDYSVTGQYSAPIYCVEQ